MTLTHLPFWLILVLEAVVLCFVGIALLFVVIRRLRQSKQKRDEKIQRLQAQLQTATARLSRELGAASTKTYADWLSEHLENTRNFHHALADGREISLELDPETPEKLRTAATRYALLTAERDATAPHQGVKWELLAARYQQLANFNRDLALEAMKRRFEQAAERLEHLEKFEQMYFELRQHWQDCLQDASNRYQTINEQALHRDDSELKRLLAEYHEHYLSFSHRFDANATEALPAPLNEPHQIREELDQLKVFAARQHEIIAELKSRLNLGEIQLDELKELLPAQLSTQAKFLNEAEVCIQMLESELEDVTRQNSRLRAALVRLQEDATDRRETVTDEQDKQIAALTRENDNLRRQTQSASGGAEAESQTRRQLQTLQAKYNELEEKFLNLKLKE